MNLLHQPSVSVLIPVYNSEFFLRETIESVLCQTFVDFEILLLDDGSTDQSSQIIKSYIDSRIKYIACSHDFIKTLNHGLEIAKGKYIALLDHDDLMVPKRLQIQHDFMEQNPDIAASGGYMHSFGKHSKLMEAPLDYVEIVKEMIHRSPMYNPTGFIRRDILQLYGVSYQDGYSFAADFKFWSDVVKVGKVVNIPEVLTIYRTSSTQTSIVYGAESWKGACRIHNEMINYLLAMVQEDNKFYPIMDEQFIPAMNSFNDYSFISSNVYLRFMYELIGGLIDEGAIPIKKIHYRGVIKVGYLVSYDYEYLKNSLPTVYKDADQICIVVDKNRKTWNGNTFEIPDVFFEWIQEYDIEHKIQIYEDEFYVPSLSPIDCETRERNLLSMEMGEGGWHIQLDVDEYFIDFEGFVAYLHSLDNEISTTIYAEWITLFKWEETDVYYIENNEKFPVATNNPKYELARRTVKENLKKSTKYKLLHHSWGRSEEELSFKLDNWGHCKEIDSKVFIDFWKSINTFNYKYISNFHPLSPTKWEKLKYVQADTIQTLIEKMK